MYATETLRGENAGCDYRPVLNADPIDDTNNEKC